MKRFFKKLLLFVLPFVLAVAMFFAVEPYDYVGLHGGEYPYGMMPIASMREALRNAGDAKNFIFGDSRLANLNIDTVSELAGERYYSLAFGGATPGESVAMFWWVAENFEIEKAYVEVSFYNIDGNQTSGRVPGYIEQVENPFKFLFNFKNWLDAINAGKNRALSALRGQYWLDDYAAYEDPRAYLPEVSTEMGEVYRADIEAYVNDYIIPQCTGYYLHSDTLEMYGEIADYCEKNGIELTFVFPPCNRAILIEVVQGLGLAPVQQRIKDYMIARANVIDMEFLNEFTEDDSNFFDGFHLSMEGKYHLAELIFTDIETDYVVRYTKGE